MLKITISPRKKKKEKETKFNSLKLAMNRKKKWLEKSIVQSSVFCNISVKYFNLHFL